ncbi:hypothetical protein Q8W71_24620 [Methylobacterium sp. NEAU 140]|uniref:hypothetical protein n=1 Tax=Methylobacterium sp. NEAU 140 TaxID=3064945 RepID=UPI002736470C|nr:hypothetical protein [Methylobacterium sp. NEAU 140]MDP4025819.1 hypothetical protein [Methylobacterium sp. NEAU 140]
MADLLTLPTASVQPGVDPSPAARKAHPKVRRVVHPLVFLCALTTTWSVEAQTVTRQIGRYTVTERPVGPWLLKASAGPLGPYCTIELRRDGQMIAYQRTTAGQGFLAIESARWQRPPGSIVDVTITTGATRWSGRAGAPVPEGLLLPIELGRGADPARVLPRFGSLTAQVGGETLRFDLAGVSEAVRAQRACLAASPSPRRVDPR